MTTRRKTGWKIDPAIIAIVAEAREAMKAVDTNDVLKAWAYAWKNGVVTPVVGALVPDEKQAEYGVGVVAAPERKETAGVEVVEEKPLAVRVETPYQIERRIRLEALRAKLEDGAVGAEQGKVELISIIKGDEVTGARVEVPASGGPVYPFDVMVGREKHQVILFKGRRVLQWVGETSTVMKKNLTPQEVMIYWRERIK